MLAKTLTIMTGLAVLGGSSFGGYIYIDNKYAWKIHVADSVQEIQAETIDYRIKEKILEVNGIKRKQNRGAADMYDSDRLLELEAEIELLKERKQQLAPANGA
ncbi:MAG: hypothetical protein ACR2PR_06005 [Pseudohongiellaceae bacterium]